MLILNKADLLLHVGLELEIGWLPPLVLGSRNPKIQPGDLGNLDCSRAIPVLDVPTTKVDRSMGDIHPQGNPHYWLPPVNAKIIAREIAQRLSQIDPSARPRTRRPGRVQRQGRCGGEEVAADDREDARRQGRHLPQELDVHVAMARPPGDRLPRAEARHPARSRSPLPPHPGDALGAGPAGPRRGLLQPEHRAARRREGRS